MPASGSRAGVTGGGAPAAGTVAAGACALARSCARFFAARLRWLLLGEFASPAAGPRAADTLFFDAAGAPSCAFHAAKPAQASQCVLRLLARLPEEHQERELPVRRVLGALRHAPAMLGRLGATEERRKHFAKLVTVKSVVAQHSSADESHLSSATIDMLFE